MIILPILTTSLIRFSLFKKAGRILIFDLGSDRVNTLPLPVKKKHLVGVLVVLCVTCTVEGGGGGGGGFSSYSPWPKVINIRPLPHVIMNECSNKRLPH